MTVPNCPYCRVDELTGAEKIMEYIPLQLEYAGSCEQYFISKYGCYNKVIQGVLRVLFKIPVIGISLDSHMISSEMNQMSRQMENRAIFPIDEWKLIGSNIDAFKEVLMIISQELFWPNSNFIPKDSLECIFIYSDKSDIIRIVQRVNDYFSTTVSLDEMIALIGDCKELKDIIVYLMEIKGGRG